jgi:thiol-disulfide isomerase/thioredoxin
MPSFSRRASLAGACALSTLMLLGCPNGKTGNGPKPLPTGDNAMPAPEVVAESVNGAGPYKLAETRGQVTIVDFWATYCEPCRKSFPKYQEMVDKFAGKLVVIGVSVDDPEDSEEQDIQAWVDELSVTFPIVWDKKKETAKAYEPEKMPTSFVIDKQGNIRHIHAGYTAEEADVIVKEVEALLAEE